MCTMYYCLLCNFRWSTTFSDLHHNILYLLAIWTMTDTTRYNPCPLSSDISHDNPLPLGLGVYHGKLPLTLDSGCIFVTHIHHIKHGLYYKILWRNIQDSSRQIYALGQVYLLCTTIACTTIILF